MAELVRRVPIVIGAHAIALLTLFKLQHDSLDDVWAWDWVAEENNSLHTRSAKQFIDSLKDYWTPVFMMALREEITKRLEAHDKEFQTDFARHTNKSYDEMYKTKLSEEFDPYYGDNQ